MYNVGFVRRVSKTNDTGRLLSILQWLYSAQTDEYILRLYSLPLIFSLEFSMRYPLKLYNNFEKYYAANHLKQLLL